MRDLLDTNQLEDHISGHRKAQGSLEGRRLW